MEHFAAHELLCPHVCRKFGERGLSFADARLIEWLTWFREEIGLPVIVNTNILTQRGYRCNLCYIVKHNTEALILYASAHTRFQAVDFNVPGLNEDNIRQFLEYYEDEMPVPIRIETGTVGWTHVDVVSDGKNKITYFK